MPAMFADVGKEQITQKGDLFINDGLLTGRRGACVHTYHKKLYEALTLLAEGDPSDYGLIPVTLGEYLSRERYVRIDDDGRAMITVKGLDLLGKLEGYRHNDLGRRATWWNIALTSLLSLLAFTLALAAFMQGGRP